MFGRDAFRVELDTVHRLVLVLKAHDQAVVGLGRDFKAGGEALAFDDQGMIARHRVRGRQTGKDTFAVMRDRGNFAVFWLRGTDDFTAKGLSDGLMAEADAEQRDVVIGCGADQVEADACVIGVARAGGNDDAFRGCLQDIFDADLVIAMDDSLDAQIPEILDQVVGEAVIIIDQDECHNPIVIPGRCGLGKGFDKLYNLFMRKQKPKLHIHSTDRGSGGYEPPPGRWRFLMIALIFLVVTLHYAPRSWWLLSPEDFRASAPEASVTVPIEKPAPVPTPQAEIEEAADAEPVIEVPSCSIALVIDDMGVNQAKSREVLEISAPLTLAFLPYAPHVSEMAADAKAKGHELLVHVPMEPLSATENPGDNALLSGMTPEQLVSALDKNLSAFTGYAGINNHMGSKFTQDEAALRVIMPVLKERGLYLLDSKTIASSKAHALALEVGVPSIERDVFLDDDVALDAVRFQAEKTLRIAVERGRAVAIGHPKENTILAIQEYMPKFAAAGCEIVPLSRLIATADVPETPVQLLPGPTLPEPGPY